MAPKAPGAVEREVGGDNPQAGGGPGQPPVNFRMERSQTCGVKDAYLLGEGWQANSGEKRPEED